MPSYHHHYHHCRNLATSLLQLASSPLAGIWTNYNAAQDPWRKPDYKSYRRTWFSNLISFLWKGGGPNVRVDAAFVWSVGTWDVAGISPISTSPEGTYADSFIMGLMRTLSAAAPLRKS